MNKSLIDLTEKYLGVIVEQTQPLTQGDLSETLMITTNHKQNYVVKNGFSPVIEGKMLQFMYDHNIKVPKVIFANDSILVLEMIQETNSFSPEIWSNLGKMLTLLHQINHDYYGWSEDYTFGKVELVNTYSINWVEFWGQYRLGQYLSRLPVSVATQIEKLINKLDQFLPAYPKKALLHGDLWTGNIIAHSNQPYLIDPACYFGHHEVDIAMLNLFGSPGDGFYSTYALLEPDWQERLPIYQIFPLMVHYILFGSYYLRKIESILKQFDL